MAGSGSGLMSWSTNSVSASDGMFTMSRNSFGTHWRLAPPMITIRGAIAPPDSIPGRPKPDAGVRDATRTWATKGGGGEHLVGHRDDVVVGELPGHRVGHHRFEHERAVAGERGFDRPLLHDVDATQELAHDPRRARVVASVHT